MNSISLASDSLSLRGFARNFSRGVVDDSVVKQGSLHPEQGITIIEYLPSWYREP
jgi:hypothetical protein